ncbi:response regulator [Paenibacillus psychroresistens]|uniref:Response regulator n=1 Tax=Paenibacillus psychroresistens TaxID=1778678 RepID=A0A6B8RFD1_9BACL|nr:response regulator [Paenibacillus psychroresistens]QGQ94076.1 response regulator [Paenibacillus psychroresistens]
MARFLVVDDSAVMRKNIKNILESAGHEVVAEAADGRDVLPAYVNSKPDVVTMDISMPVTDGIDALKLLVKNFPEAKVIMVSALGQKAQILEAIKHGAKSYIIKPIETDKFIEIIRKIIQ